jgi:hypothetical protein
MILDQIRKRVHEDFKPFTLHLSNGRKFHVAHPDFIALATKIIVVIDEDEISHTINPVHIVTIEDSSPRKAA